MKKRRLCLTVIAVMLTVGVQAQYSDLYYHRVGDTIEWRSPIGYYSWWEFEYFYEHGLCLQISTANPWGGPFESGIGLQQYYTPVPLKIIGVAGSPFQFVLADNYGYPYDGPMPIPQYFYVYDATPTGLVPVAEVPWNLQDPHRTLHVITHHPTTDEMLMYYDSCCLFNPVDEYVPIYEYYFDSAVTVMDSFYVGGSLNGNELFLLVDTPAVQTVYAAAVYRREHRCDMSHQTLRCEPSNVNYYLTYTTQMAVNWQEFYYPSDENSCGGSPGIVYPIIEVDTTVPPEGYCPRVENLVVQSVDSLGAMVTWDGFPNYTSVTLAYGLVNVPTNQWNSVEVEDSAFYRITGLEKSRNYGVRVKALCDKGETAWSETVSFYVPDTSVPAPGDSTAGVSTALSSLTFLSPNPASESVVVSSSFGLQNIDIYDLRGILVYSEHAIGHRVEVPLTGFTPGTYIMAIGTFNGTTHKRLIVK